jgi:hypothetical protein
MRSLNGYLVILVLVWHVSVGAGVGPVSFPENQRVLISPNKEYSIYNTDSDRELIHSLYMENRTSGIRERVLDYGRHVDVMWAENSDAFFVNDYSGSSEASCLVFSTDGLKRLDIKDLLAVLGEKDILQSDHLYVTCKKWVKAEIVIAVSGRGGNDPNGFDRKYRVNPYKPEIHRVS